MYRRILLATDGTPLSKKAAAAAIDLAGRYGAVLVALTVVPRYPMSYFVGGSNVEPEEVARLEQQWAGSGQAIVDAVKLAASQHGVTTRAVTTRSDLVAESILAAARKHKADLIVMASHGRKGLKRLLLGSETQHMLTHADGPVLVLR